MSIAPDQLFRPYYTYSTFLRIMWDDGIIICLAILLVVYTRRAVYLIWDALSSLNNGGLRTETGYTIQSIIQTEPNSSSTAIHQECLLVSSMTVGSRWCDVSSCRLYGMCVVYWMESIIQIILLWEHYYVIYAVRRKVELSSLTRFLLWCFPAVLDDGRFTVVCRKQLRIIRSVWCLLDGVGYPETALGSLWKVNKVHHFEFRFVRLHRHRGKTKMIQFYKCMKCYETVERIWYEKALWSCSCCGCSPRGIFTVYIFSSSWVSPT